KALIASLSILLLAPLHAFGQGGASGSITGYVYDQTGVPLKGIKLTASSSTQIGGSKVTYSNDEGFFRIPALFPGKFELKATAPKMKTYVQKDIPVGLTSTVELSIIMDVEAADVDQVTVLE